MHHPNRRVLVLLALGLITLSVAMLVAINVDTTTEPTLPDAADGVGDRILVDKFAYPFDEERNFIKRLSWPPAGDVRRLLAEPSQLVVGANRDHRYQRPVR